METLGENLNTPHHCIKCDYDMQESQSGICPECGEPFDAAVMDATMKSWRIPRWLAWSLFAPAASCLLLIPVVPLLSRAAPAKYIVLFSLAVSMYLAIRTAAIIARMRCRLRPDDARTLGFFVRVSGISIAIFALQYAATWLVCLASVTIVLKLGWAR